MTDPMLKRLSLALYRKAEALGLCVDPEGSGDLGPSTVLVMTVLEEMREPTASMIAAAAASHVDKDQAWFIPGRIWHSMLDDIKEGK